MSSPKEQVTLTYLDASKIALITFNVEGKLNALSQDLYYRLGELLREVARKEETVVTVITGRGRFFSAGADVSLSRDQPEETDLRRHWLTSFAAHNLDLTRTMSQHPKILVAALNGPAIGLSAGLLGLMDFIYAVPDAWLLTPFSSLGLVAEGASSRSFVERLGIAKANEALLMSKRLGVRELLACGFVNQVFEPATQDSDEDRKWFLERVLKEVRDGLTADDRLNGESLLRIKALIRREEREKLERVNVEEVMGGLEMFSKGVPQREFRRLATGEKKHKL
ncbi:MAG: hypothetical protein M4579_003623 [Chaenotheca gracillima]|nr:MAG: hypothetical protein M4579_003623 [Chaenotheca gracillima]